MCASGRPGPDILFAVKRESIVSGYSLVLKLRKLEAKADRLGFMFSYPKNRYDTEHDTVALKPKDEESVPIYSRDAEVFVGSMEELSWWLQGVEWARDYDRMLKVSDDEKRARKEQDVRNRHLVQLLKSEKVAQHE